MNSLPEAGRITPMPEHFIAGKDASLEASIGRMQAKLAQIGFHVEERSWLNPVEDIWSVHVSECDCPLLFTNGKGASKLAALASALGEFFERLSCNYFWTRNSPRIASCTIRRSAGSSPTTRRRGRRNC